MVKSQVITDTYALYNSDCMYVMADMPDKSVDFSVYSPPFAGLYNYSSHENDFSNCKDRGEFLAQYEFMVREVARLTKPGRITAVHCTDIMDRTSGEHLWDFPHEIIKIHEAAGFRYRNRITIWKEPLKVRIRTMVRSLMHKLIVEDSTECFTAMPDYVLIFKRAGENAVPVTHDMGLFRYAGETPILPNILASYNNENNTSYTAETLWEHLNVKYKGWQDPKTNKLSHYIWQRYASPVWDDIRIDEVLPFRETKEDDDEKHVHPLQMDVVDRLVDLYTNPGEVVLTPFMGVGTEVYCPVSMGRYGVGVELKTSYFSQAVNNLKSVESRYETDNQISLKL